MYQRLLESRYSYFFTMRCPKTGFTPLKIASLVVGGITIIIHITAVAYPEWDGINIHTQSQRIQGYGSIWDFTVTEDSTNKFFYNSSARHLMDKGKFFQRYKYSK